MTEIQIQAACYQWFHNTFPHLRKCLFHVPNGGSRNKIEAMHLKASGVVAGIPDLLFLHKGRIYAFELKTATGTLSPAQKAVHDAWKGQGVDVHVVRSFEEFKILVEGIVNRL